MNSDSKLEKIQSWVSKWAKGKLLFHNMAYKIPISRLVAIALENELEKENPFAYDVTLPTEEYVEFAYADQAGRILNYLKGEINGFDLQTLCMLRKDMLIPDKKEFLLAFRECLEKGLVESYKPTRQSKSYTDYAEDYVMYRLKGEGAPERKKKRREASEFGRFQRLKKKYGDK